MTNIGNVSKTDEPTYAAIAERILEDHATGVRFRPFAVDYGIRSLADAYSVQHSYVLLKRTRSKSNVVGYKLGLTSKQIQAMCGVKSPISGVMLSDKILESPATLDGSGFGRIGFEFEIAVRIGTDIRRGDSPLSVTDVAKCVDGVSPAIELFDDRGCDYNNFDTLSLVADNAWSVGLIHGAFEKQWPNLSEVEGIVEADGLEIGRVFGRDALGHPFIALTWLANHLADMGENLRAGEIVTTGSLMKPQFPAKSTHYRYSVAGLGQVSCHVTM